MPPSKFVCHSIILWPRQESFCDHGVPAEVKSDEYRVALLPVGVEELVARGHQVIIESGAGLGSGLADHDYLRAGAELVGSGQDVFDRAT